MEKECGKTRCGKEGCESRAYENKGCDIEKVVQKVGGLT